MSTHTKGHDADVKEMRAAMGQPSDDDPPRSIHWDKNHRHELVFETLTEDEAVRHAAKRASVDGDATSLETLILSARRGNVLASALLARASELCEQVRARRGGR